MVQDPKVKVLGVPVLSLSKINWSGPIYLLVGTAGMIEMDSLFFEI